MVNYDQLPAASSFFNGKLYLDTQYFFHVPSLGQLVDQLVRYLAFCINGFSNSSTL